jgi:Rieske Fe-S protein
MSGRRAGGGDGCPCHPNALCAPVSPARRALLKQALATGAAAFFPGTSIANDLKALRPQAGDLFVHVSGDRTGEVIAPADLADKPVLAWPMEPASRTIRDGSRLNQVLLVRLDPATLDDATRARAAEGVVGYSASCTHALCPVTGWKAEGQILKCHCHNSEFDPSLGAKVVFGPAPRPLPSLPLKVADGQLMAAGSFIGRVGNTS